MWEGKRRIYFVLFCLCSLRRNSKAKNTKWWISTKKITNENKQNIWTFCKQKSIRQCLLREKRKWCPTIYFVFAQLLYFLSLLLLCCSFFALVFSFLALAVFCRRFFGSHFGGRDHISICIRICTLSIRSLLRKYVACLHEMETLDIPRHVYKVKSEISYRHNLNIHC